MDTFFFDDFISYITLVYVYVGILGSLCIKMCIVEQNTGSVACYATFFSIPSATVTADLWLNVPIIGEK